MNRFKLLSLVFLPMLLSACSVSLNLSLNANSDATGYQLGETSFYIDTNISTYSTSHYLYIITPVTNTGNENIFLSYATYDIYDADENPVMTISRFYTREVPTLLAPGEIGYFTADVPYDKSAIDGLTIVPHVTIKNAKNYQTKRYQISNVSFSVTSYGFIEGVGKVKNKLNEKGRASDSITIAVFDKNGKYLLTIVSCVNANLATGEEAIFKASSISRCSITDANQIGSYVAYGEFYQYVY